MGRPRKPQPADQPSAQRPGTVSEHLRNAVDAHALIRTHLPDGSPEPPEDGSPEAAPAQTERTP